MMTKTRTTEVEIAAAVRAYLEAQGLKVRSELPVTLPDHGQVFADLVGYKANPDHDWYTVVECKMRLDETLEAQAKRWLGFAGTIIAAYQLPKVHKDRNERRNWRLDYCGIYRYLVEDGVIVNRVENAGQIQTWDDRLISSAFHSSDGSIDPPAGVAAAKRATEARTQWESLRKYLQTESGLFTWTEIKRNVPELRKFTPHQVRAAIIKEECVGVGMQIVRGITQFFAKGEGTK